MTVKRNQPHQAPTVAPAALINEKQAAEVLGMSVRTLQAWRVAGGGPPFVKLGVNVRYRPETLSRWIEENTVASTSATAATA
ncbi:helix-turn-helix domain-containing protein [uncultured Thiodictyon sp.]|uniref:helix-turn-helix domain-containing protein n=1 Tax=uncultured Thiodictyon sp. TaxID=1846217 RepID=UPI0025FDC3BA|nr:helix-turn-helix domain-containing protein [uncultured Thiodictyon sp.]